MAANYSRQIFSELTKATKEIDRLKYTVIPEIKKEYEAKLYDTRVTASENLAAVRKEKDSRISELETENVSLKEQLLAATDEIVRLKNILNQDSTNSSLPPSTDQTGLKNAEEKKRKAANEYNGREKTEKHKGGQEGHEGKTLTKEDVQKLLEEHGDKIIHEVVEVGKTDENGDESPRVKYELDLVVKTIIREFRYYGSESLPPRHYPDVSFGDFARAASAYCYGECNMPTDKIGDLMNTLSGGILCACDGSWYNFCTYVSDNCDESLDSLYGDLRNSNVLYSDATFTSENGEETYVRNVSNKNTVIYHPQDSKTIGEIGKTPVLSDFFGILMTDHETAMKHFGSKHAECNQHAGRYCRKNTEETEHSWSEDFMSLLYEIKASKESLQEQGITSFTREVLTDYFARYDAILKKGWAENPSVTWKSVASDERSLLRRLAKYKEDHLRFATDFDVEFTNNISESDLRFIKNRTKVSGGFRQKSGRTMCCRLMSVIRTCKKRGMSTIDALVTISKTGANAFA